MDDGADVSGGTFYNQNGAVVNGDVSVSDTGTFSNNTGGQVNGDADVTGGLFISNGALSGTANVSGGTYTNQTDGTVGDGVALSGTGAFGNAGAVNGSGTVVPFG